MKGVEAGDSCGFVGHSHCAEVKAYTFTLEELHMAPCDSTTSTAPLRDTDIYELLDDCTSTAMKMIQYSRAA